ncbi:MAG: cobyric acid synthase [Calditerrivibrio sp.]|nr:cobyric acid synthase [Calditerrivibrio sp.]MCA1932723.1 cobyric acid synthase [Calditerrivibrio sp.]
MKRHKCSIFIGGTSSGAGKSLITAALCRIFKEDGFNPAPFKGQNMSLNSYVTIEGLEMARAQVLQAEAAMIEPEVDMNPVLLKPFGDSTSQLILKGKPQFNVTSIDLYRDDINQMLEKNIMESFDKIAKKYFPVVIEGAGSVSELNLKRKDLANTNLALKTDSDIYLVSNIEYGGVFASLYGSIKLMSRTEQARVKGIIVNKFRGDMRLFDEGVRILEDITKRKVLGVVPYINRLYLDEEDSMSIEDKKFKYSDVKIAVVRLPYISNFTDFTTLSQIEGVSLIYTVKASDLEEADIIIIPGTKSTTKDMKFLIDSGLKEVILKQHKDGKMLIGICGGYQIMGLKIIDENRLEGEIEQIDGLGILPVVTTLEKQKITKRSSFYFSSHRCTGYEIHSGRTELIGGEPIVSSDDGKYIGCKISNRSFGIYIHGFFDNRAVLESILEPYGLDLKSKRIYPEKKEDFFKTLAETVRKSIDVKLIYHNLGLL